MLPSYKPGDHVLTFNWTNVKKGDVVVFCSPTRYFIKRVDKYVDNYVYVSGDNKRQRAKVKPIKADQIVGKVILKY